MTTRYTTRYTGAITAQAGACNPIAILNTMLRGCEEIRKETGSYLPTQAILEDPAMRLLCHQLAFLMKANEEQIGAEYLTLIRECEQAAEGQRKC